MVRAVVADETQFNLIEARLSSSRVHVQVGLVIGKPGSNKDSIFTLIPTPLNPDGKNPASLSDDSRPDNKKKSKPSHSLQIDVDWVAEHARQVSKMLVGGMYVVGIYIWGVETIFKTSSLVLYQTIKEVSRATKEYGNVEAEERLAVHISYSPKRLSCWSCSVDESFTPTSFRPCDLKTIKLLSTLQTFASIQNIKLRLPLLKHEVQSSNGMKSILLKAVELLSEHLQSAKAIFDESLISENCEVGTGENREIEFLFPFGNMMSLPDGKGESDEQVFGLLNFRGTVFAQAYLFPRETLFQAIEELKRDIIGSLRSRIEILCDEAEEQKSVTDEQNVHYKEDVIDGSPLFSCNWSREPCNFVLPRRVFVPWMDGIFACDYLQSKETFQDLNERCKELLSIQLVDFSTIREPESEGTCVSGESFWSRIHESDASIHSSLGESIGNKDLKEQSSTIFPLRALYYILIVSVVIVSVLIALLLKVTSLRTVKNQ